MARFRIQGTAIRQAGSGLQILKGASVQVTNSSGDLATIYENDVSAAALDNPLTVGSDGAYDFYVDSDVAHYDLLIQKGGANVDLRVPVYADAAAVEAAKVATAVDAETAASNAAASIAAQNAAEAAATQAVAAAEQAIAAQGSGDIVSYVSNAEATTAAAGLADGVLLQVLTDETRSNRRTAYSVSSGSLVFVRYMETVPVEYDTLAAFQAETVANLQAIYGMTGTLIATIKKPLFTAEIDLAQTADFNFTTTGAVEVNILPAPGNVVHVDNFDPVLDGTDDTRLQIAMTTAANAELRFTRGKTYRFYGLLVPEGCDVNINGATLIKRNPVFGVDSDDVRAFTGAGEGSGFYAAGSDMYYPGMYITGDNVRIRNGNYHGAFSELTIGDDPQPSAGGGRLLDRVGIVCLAAYSGAETLTIEGVNFDDWHKFPIVADGVQNMTIRDCVEKNSHAGFCNVDGFVDADSPSRGTCIFKNNKLHGTREWASVPNCYVITGYINLLEEGLVVDGSDKLTSLLDQGGGTFNAPDAPKIQEIVNYTASNNIYIDSGIKIGAKLGKGFIGNSFTVTGCKFIGTAGSVSRSGVVGGNAVYDHIDINGCTFVNCNAEGILIGRKSTKVRNNAFETTVQQPLNSGDQWAFVYLNTTSGHTDFGDFEITGNTVKHFEADGHMFIYCTVAAEALIISNNSVSGCDVVWGNIGSVDFTGATIKWTKNEFRSNRSLGLHRIQNIRSWAFDDNDVFDMSSTASVFHTNPFTIQFGSGSGTWGNCSVSDNTILDSSGRLILNFLISAGATCTRMKLNGNDWPVGPASSCIVSNGAALNITSLAVLRNTCAQNISLGSGWSATSQRIAENDFLNAGGRVVNGNNVSFGGGSTATAGAGSATNIIVDINGTNYTIPATQVT